MIIRLRRSSQQIQRHPLITIGIIFALFALIAFIFAVYLFDWDWTGFNGGVSKITVTSTSKGTTTVK